MALINPVVAMYEASQDATMTVTLSPAEDITGWTITLTVRAYAGGTALITKTVGSGIELTTPASGIFTVTFSAANLALAPGAYLYEITRTNSGYVYPIVSPSLFLITGAAGSSYPTLTNASEAAAILNLASFTDDTAKQWTMLIAGVEDAIRKQTGRKLTYGTYTEYLDGNQTPILQLKEYPVHSITSVNVDSYGYAGQADDPFNSTTLLEEGVDYYLDKRGSTDGTSLNGHLIRIGQPWPIYKRRPIGRLGHSYVGTGGSVKVVYVGGYSLVPFDLKLAIAQACQTLQLSLPYGGLISSQSGEGYSLSISSPDVQAKLFASTKNIISTYKSVAAMVG